MQGRGKKQRAGSRPASTKGTVAKKPENAKKGFSDDNASWLKPANAPKPADSDADSLSDGDIIDDEFVQDGSDMEEPGASDSPDEGSSDMDMPGHGAGAQDSDAINAVCCPNPSVRCSVGMLHTSQFCVLV